MCTSQDYLSNAHDDPLYLLNHTYDGVRCGAPTVIQEAQSEYQTIVCSAKKLYNQRLATLSTYHQLTPMSRSRHIYTVGGRGGAMPYRPGFLPVRTLYANHLRHTSFVVHVSLARSMPPDWSTTTSGNPLSGGSLVCGSHTRRVCGLAHATLVASCNTGVLR